MDNYKYKYFKELSKSYKNEKQVIAEIINLTSILNLPKGTEHFVSDIHGEYEMFLHILKTASGTIKRRIDDEFGKSLTSHERDMLATLIYYPQEKLKVVEKSEDWYRITLYRLICVCKNAASKYTRSKVRKMLPKSFAYIIDELLNCDGLSVDKETYYSQIIESIISLCEADDFIIEICNLIQNLAIDHLHIVGDIYDRGSRPDIIMDYLKNYKSVDIQWGNHDILWLGAALGDPACIMTALCDSFKYGNTEFLEDGYAINLMPLYNLVSKFYKDDPCENCLNQYNDDWMAKLYKSVLVIKLKLEDQYRLKYPDFDMQNQTILDKIDFEKQTWKGHKLLSCNFPTIDPKNPTKLCPEEEEVVEKLIHSFESSEKLRKHMKFLITKGSLYLVYNGNLLFHGSVPLDKNGDFQVIEFEGEKWAGKEYLDYCDMVVRRAFENKDEKDLAFIWQLWCGSKSPVFGKDKMATFERMFVIDKSTHAENKLYYFLYQDNEQICDKILLEFGLDPKNGQIVNGHIPVKHSQHESPIKANGKMLVIDGGMSKPYQKVTGIAGYTLTYHSWGMSIASHEAFLGKENVVKNDAEVLAVKYTVSKKAERITVSKTDDGKRIQNTIEDLKFLLEMYHDGILDSQQNV